MGDAPRNEGGAISPTSRPRPPVIVLSDAAGSEGAAPGASAAPLGRAPPVAVMEATPLGAGMAAPPVRVTSFVIPPLGGRTSALGGAASGNGGTTGDSGMS